MSRLLLIPLCLILLLAGAMVWSGGGVEGRADLRFVNAGDPKTLDPGQMSWGQDIRLANALWEGLYRFDSTNMQPGPGVAERVDVSDDKTVYTFHLRPTARWSNGDPVTANDFAFAWKRVLDQPASYTSLFYYIDGAQAYSEALRAANAALAKDPDAPVTLPRFADVGIQVADARTLRVKLKHPVPFFPDLCAFPTFFPLHEASIPPHLVSRHPKTDAITIRQGFTKPPLISNGAYVMDDWQYKQRIRLKRNDAYWDAAAVKLATIDVVSAEDGFSAFQMYETGAVDWIADVHPEVAAKLKQTTRDDFKVTTGFGTYYYEFLTEPKLPDGRPNPFHDKRVRQAFSMAIDKEAITGTIVTTGEKATTTYIPRGIFEGYPSPQGLSFDVPRAQALLAEAGYPLGRGFPQVTLLYNTGGGHERTAEYIRRQWLANLGVTVSLEGVEVKTFGALKEQKKFHVCRASWIGDYTDPSTFTDKYLSFSENNDAAWKSPEYDRLCAAAAVEPDAQKRLRLLHEAETLLLDDAAVLPIYSYVNRVLQKPHVKGLQPNPRNQQDFKRLWVER